MMTRGIRKYPVESWGQSMGWSLADQTQDGRAFRKLLE